MKDISFFLLIYHPSCSPFSSPGLFGSPICLIFPVFLTASSSFHDPSVSYSHIHREHAIAFILPSLSEIIIPFHECKCHCEAANSTNPHLELKTVFQAPVSSGSPTDSCARLRCWHRRWKLSLAYHSTAPLTNVLLSHSTLKPNWFLLHKLKGIKGTE